ncbi:hypothetical protein [Streptomyces violaceus]|uniref:Uncharacterized protein n=1 Tax=Streptomyces violaceus TaxID=1936 RepID=A0ABZ1NVT6_STRVL
MQRILAGTPEHFNGALTIVALAIEAQVPRNALTQRHPDLLNEFYARVQERGAVPDAEARLRKTIVKLKETIANKKRGACPLAPGCPRTRPSTQPTDGRERSTAPATGAADADCRPLPCEDTGLSA